MKVAFAVVIFIELTMYRWMTRSMGRKDIKEHHFCSHRKAIAPLL